MKRFRLERLAVPRDVELDSNPIHTGATVLLPPSASSEVADDLAVETTASLGFRTDSAPEIVEPLEIATFGEHLVRFCGGCSFKYGKDLLFSRSRFSLKKNGALHSPQLHSDSDLQNLRASASHPLPVNEVGFRSEGLL